MRQTNEYMIAKAIARGFGCHVCDEEATQWFKKEEPGRSEYFIASTYGLCDEHYFPDSDDHWEISKRKKRDYFWARRIEQNHEGLTVRFVEGKELEELNKELDRQIARKFLQS